MAESKPNLYNVSQLRTITDENLGSIFDSLGYTESFKLHDIKLGLGLFTVALSGLLFLIEKKLDFKDSFNLTVAILSVYFIVSGIIWYLSQAKPYKDVKYIGYNEANEKITITTNSPKYEPIYNISVRFGDDQEGTKTKIEFTKLFDTFSNFQPENLKELFEQEITKKKQ